MKYHQLLFYPKYLMKMKKMFHMANKKQKMIHCQKYNTNAVLGKNDCLDSPIVCEKCKQLNKFILLMSQCNGQSIV